VSDPETAKIPSAVPLESHAENFEDVMLWRALHHVEAGFFIDVGAGDPVVGSVSQAFYQRGWRGLLVDPSPACARQYKKLRKGDEVVAAALAESSGKTAFFEADRLGASTTDRGEARLRGLEGVAFEEIAVPSASLDDILARAGTKEVHWLRIGVPGQTIGWSKARPRPWVILAATPFTLAAGGYQEVYRDGANRYFVAEEHGELASAFAAGPNAHDHFTLAEGNPHVRALSAAIAAMREQVDTQRKYSDALERDRTSDRAFIDRLNETLAQLRRDHAEHLVTATLHAEQAAEAYRLCDEALRRSEAAEIALVAELGRANTELGHVNAELESAAHLLTQTAARLRAIESSRSWRWTGPVRRLIRVLKASRERRS
jgi:FkbM family methyltransferase